MKKEKKLSKKKIDQIDKIMNTLYGGDKLEEIKLQIKLEVLKHKDIMKEIKLMAKYKINSLKRQ